MYNTPILSVSYTIQRSPPDIHAPPLLRRADEGSLSLFAARAAAVLSGDSCCISPPNKRLSHKWKLLQSHLPRLTVSVSLPIVLAAICPPGSAAVHLCPAVGNQFYLCEAVFQYARNHTGDVLPVWPAPLICLVQLLRPRHSAKAPLDVNYWIVLHIW